MVKTVVKKRCVRGAGSFHSSSRREAFVFSISLGVQMYRSLIILSVALFVVYLSPNVQGDTGFTAFKNFHCPTVYDGAKRDDVKYLYSDEKFEFHWAGLDTKLVLKLEYAVISDRLFSPILKGSESSIFHASCYTWLNFLIK